jgi:hypothetical protein
LAKQNEMLKPEQAVTHSEMAQSGETNGKRLFVEPEISVPVDVLEATTFFQATTSGATN